MLLKGSLRLVFLHFFKNKSSFKEKIKKSGKYGLTYRKQPSCYSEFSRTSQSHLQNVTQRDRSLARDLSW